ncbi:MAG: sodium-translocating pyrophosphatase [Nitrososphaerales archaeon]
MVNILAEPYFWIAPIGGIASILAALILAWRILSIKVDDPKAAEIASAIRIGAYAFMKRQYTTITIIAIIIAAILLAAGFVAPKEVEAIAVHFGPGAAVAFLIGAFASLLAGFIAMDMATRSNVRTVIMAKRGIEPALKTAFHGGAIMGLLVTGLSLLGVTVLFILYGADETTPTKIIGMGFGASLVALFAQLGGGIYTKAADVGADLVGKVEAGIPEDDPRNAAVIADNVGDNVGDSAGRGADLFESATAENIGGMIIGGVIAYWTQNWAFLIFPIIARALGIFATLIGMPFVRLSKGEEHKPMRALHKGLTVTTIMSAVLFYVAIQLLFGSEPGGIYLYFSMLAGLAASILVQVITDYYTGRERGPVRRIADASQTGTATNIITGFSVGLETTALPIASLGACLLVAYYFGTLFGAANPELGANASLIGGVYGTTLATMGMLAVMGMVLALDGFGPIADNAGGIAEMSGQKGIDESMEALDAVGNTTKALTKGFAMGSALLAAQLLFQAYIEAGNEYLRSVGLPEIRLELSNPVVLVSTLIGAMLPFIFSAFAIKAVGSAAKEMVNEVRRQFREIVGLMEGRAKPEYDKAVDISTRAALKEMVLPGLLVVIVPIVVGVLLGLSAVGALVIGATMSGIPLAILMNTGGAAWDNAKKFIEAGNLGGKGSPTHAAAVVGDTVGDPMKDTAGPSLHVLIKLLNTLSILFIPLFIGILGL